MRAARHYGALFRGEESLEADVAGIEFARIMKLVEAFIMAHAEKK